MMEPTASHKAHSARHSGRKREKKKAKGKKDKFDKLKEAKKRLRDDDRETAQKRNPKAFTFKSINKTAKIVQRGADVAERKVHIPIVDRTPIEPPPIVVAIVGPTKVGKTTLLRGLLRHYMRHSLTRFNGPITLVTGKHRRVTFMEVPNDINAMIDAAKIADLVLLLIDASYGFEMETFEFLHVCKAHGEPRIMGVLTHMDMIEKKQQLKAQKKKLKHRFWTEVYRGAKMFYFTRLKDDQYMHNEVKNLARFISVMRFRPLMWRTTHPYVLVDRYEDVTDAESVKRNPKCNRSVLMYGYVRGTNIKENQAVHIPGVGDMRLASLTALGDPCPLPDVLKKRSLSDRERKVYAPLCGLGGVIIDKDAIYIDTGTSHASEKKANPLIAHLTSSSKTVDDSMRTTQLSLFGGEESALNPESDSELSDEEDAIETELTDDELDDSKPSTSSVNLPQPKRLRVESAALRESRAALRATLSDDFQARLAARATALYNPRTTHSNINWMRLVYDERDAQIVPNVDETDNEEVGGLFKISVAQRTRDALRSDVRDQFDCCVYMETRVPGNWADAEMRALIADCFVTGQWTTEEDAFNEGGADDTNDEEDDMEDSEMSSASDAEMSEEDEDEEEDDDEEKQQSRDKGEEYSEEGLRIVGKTDEDLRAEKREKLAKKRAQRLKHMFGSDADPEMQYYSLQKTAYGQQAEKNRQTFADVDEATRVQLEGYRAGMYVRMRFDDCPCELVDNFDPKFPYIIGGLLPAEQNIGVVQMRVKRHRWFPRTLKTRDPLIISLGWRRFQTIMLYHVQEHNGRNRLLKYTPEHLYCHAACWGPMTPQNTPFIALQSVAEMNAKHFRLCASGVVVNLDKSLQIVKKLKLTGYPYETSKKTAFIRGMFSSPLEVARFEGAQLRAVSGLRGQIKKALREPPGAFRATFEDKILLKDIVFMRAWVNVPVPDYYAPVCNLLLPEPKLWQGMKTVGQLRYERGLKAQYKDDSMYRPLERRPWIPEQLNVPRQLQKALPYEYKPKHEARKPKDEREMLIKQHTAVVMEPHESKVHSLMNMVRASVAARRQENRAKMKERVRAHRRAQAIEEAKGEKRRKQMKASVCRRLSKREKSALKTALRQINKK